MHTGKPPPRSNPARCLQDKVLLCSSLRTRKRTERRFFLEQGVCLKREQIEGEPCPSFLPFI